MRGTYPAERITSSVAQVVYDLPSTLNSAPVAIKRPDTFSDRTFVTGAPTRTFKLGLSRTGSRYASAEYAIMRPTIREYDDYTPWLVIFDIIGELLWDLPCVRGCHEQLSSFCRPTYGFKAPIVIHVTEDLSIIRR